MRITLELLFINFIFHLLVINKTLNDYLASYLASSEKYWHKN